MTLFQRAYLMSFSSAAASGAAQGSTTTADLGVMPEWDLSDLYTAPDAPEVSRDLEKGAADAKALKETWAGKVAGITGNEIFRSYQSAMIGALNRELYQRHDVLTHFQPGALDVLHFMPPLIVTREQIDHVVDGLDDILTRGMTDATVHFVVANAKRVLRL